MRWYTVVKTIKGRRYLYRQRTYRVGGKVRTESRYVGAAEGDGVSKLVSVTSLDEPEAQSVAINDKTRATAAKTVIVDNGARARRDVSITALEKEESFARDAMAGQGLHVDDLKPVRVSIGRAADWKATKSTYRVYLPRQGNRTRFKKQYRTVLGMRWLETLRDQNRDRYERLRAEVDFELAFLRTQIPVKQHWFTYLVSWWTGRSQWKMDVAEMAGEMLQRGSAATYKRYGKQAIAAERSARREWRRFKRLKQPKARRRQYRKAQAAYNKSHRLNTKLSIAIWTRLFLYGERPHDK